MRPEDLKVLTERAVSVEGRPAQRLDEVHERIAVARRRRQVGTVSAAVVAVVLALTAGVGLLALTRTDDTGPAKPVPRPTSTPSVLVEEAPPVRRLTYATGEKIHWGDRTIDVGRKVWQLAATDDGVVFIREEGDRCFRGGRCRALWFTDGSHTARIGTPTGSTVRGFDIDFSTGGSIVVWSEPDPEDHTPYYPRRGELVAYDTGEGREVARFGTGDSELEAVYDDYVYWTPRHAAKPWCLDFSKPYGLCRRHGRVMRLDTATGTQTEVPWATYISDRRSRPRLFFGPTDKPDSPYNPFPYNRPGAEKITFGRQGDRLVAEDGSGGVVTARVGPNGEPVRLRLAPGYPEVDDFFMVGWLDDDRVVLQADNDNSLLVCRLPSGRCRTVVAGPLLADFGGRG
jgi:hypothetical protein